MRRALSVVLLVLTALAAIAVPGAVASESSSVSRVVMVLSPYLTWDDVVSPDSPTLTRLARTGAVGNINIRNRNRTALYPGTVEQGVLTFSAGAWAALDASSPSAYSVQEAYHAGTAGEAYTRMSGVDPAENDIVYLGMPRIERLSRGAETLDVRPGTIGGEILAAGGVTAAIGNSDPGRDPDYALHSRPAALVAMDHAGGVRYGDVSASLLRDDIKEPFGVATDVTALSRTLDGVEKAIIAQEGPALVVLDIGDLARSASVEGVTAPALAARQHADAVKVLDRVVERAWETLPADALLMVLTPIESETSSTVTGLAPAIVYGPGFTGELTSPSTHRAGLVTNLDVAATVLDAFGIDRPVQVLGNVMVADGSKDPLEQRIAYLEQMDTTAVSVDAAKASVLNGYIGVTMLVLLLSTFLLLRANRWSDRSVTRLASASRIALLGVLSVPPASLVMFIVDGQPQGSSQAVATLLAVTLVIWMALLIVQRYTGLHVPVAAASLLAAGLILLDQLLGAPWSFTSFMGYSPIMAARYYGIGNEGAAILYGAMLVGLAFVLDGMTGSRFAAFGRRWIVPLAGLAVVVASAAPFLGANVGVAAWGVVGFAFAWALMNGYRTTWKLWVAVFAIVVLMVAIFSAIDLIGDSGSQTHLGRAWTSADQGGLGELWLIVQRKAETNLRVLTHTNWSFILIGVLGFLGFMRWHPRGDFADTLDQNPHFSAAMAASLLGGLAAYFTEDSGIVIPALIMLYVGAGILYLMTSKLCDREGAREGGVA